MAPKSINIDHDEDDDDINEDDEDDDDRYWQMNCVYVLRIRNRAVNNFSLLIPRQWQWQRKPALVFIYLIIYMLAYLFIYFSFITFIEQKTSTNCCDLPRTDLFFAISFLLNLFQRHSIRELIADYATLN